MSLSAFLAAWGLHLMAAASPGPSVLLSARTGAKEGFLTASWLALGLGIGAVIWAIAALFGLALLFQWLPSLFWLFRVIGGAFLIWLAIQVWRHAAEPLISATDARAPRSPLSALLLGLGTQLSNPKPAVFFGAVFVGTIPSDTTSGWIALLLLAIFLNELACNIIIARLFSFERCRQGYARMKTAIDRGFGAVLAVLGLKIVIG